MEKQIKICEGCKREIKENKERYVHIEDWAFAEFIKDSWWHLNCFSKAMNKPLTTLEKQAANMLSKAGTIFDNLPNEFKKKQMEVVP